MDNNDHAPEFTKPVYTADIYENEMAGKILTKVCFIKHCLFIKPFTTYVKGLWQKLMLNFFP